MMSSTYGSTVLHLTCFLIVNVLYQSVSAKSLPVLVSRMAHPTRQDDGHFLPDGSLPAGTTDNKGYFEKYCKENPDDQLCKTGAVRKSRPKPPMPEYTGPPPEYDEESAKSLPALVSHSLPEDDGHFLPDGNLPEGTTDNKGYFEKYCKEHPEDPLCKTGPPTKPRPKPPMPEYTGPPPDQEEEEYDGHFLPDGSLPEGTKDRKGYFRKRCQEHPEEPLCKLAARRKSLPRPPMPENSGLPPAYSEKEQDGDFLPDSSPPEGTTRSCQEHPEDSICKPANKRKFPRSVTPKSFRTTTSEVKYSEVPVPNEYVESGGSSNNKKPTSDKDKPIKNSTNAYEEVPVPHEFWPSGSSVDTDNIEKITEEFCKDDPNPEKCKKELLDTD